jgi:hypothetical protein
MNRSKFWKPVVLSLIATPISLFVGIASGGAGHGNYLAAKVLFPFTMLSIRAFGSITAPFVILAIIQFPLYGVIVGSANRKGKLLPYVIAVVVVHTLAALTCFGSVGENFS